MMPSYDQFQEPLPVPRLSHPILVLRSKCRARVINKFAARSAGCAECCSNGAIPRSFSLDTGHDPSQDSHSSWPPPSHRPQLHLLSFRQNSWPPPPAPQLLRHESTWTLSSKEKKLDRSGHLSVLSTFLMKKSFWLSLGVLHVAGKDRQGLSNVCGWGRGKQGRGAQVKLV